MQWHGTICIVKVFLLSEREISPNYTGIFLDFVHGFGSYVKGLPKTKRCNSVAVTVSVWFRFGFGVYVKQPLPVVFAEIRPPKPKKIKSKSCTFSVRRSVSVRFRFRRICESAHRV